MEEDGGVLLLDGIEEDGLPSVHEHVDADEAEVHGHHDAEQGPGCPAILRGPVWPRETPGVAEELPDVGHALGLGSLCIHCAQYGPRPTFWVVGRALMPYTLCASLFGEVAESAEGSRLLSGYRGKTSVPGSNPGLSANAPLAQMDRASDYESEGQRFDSSRAHHLFMRLRESG